MKIVLLVDGIIYLNYEEWKNICKDKDCYIKIDISLVEVNFQEEPEPILEISINKRLFASNVFIFLRTVKKMPFILTERQKNKRTDIYRQSFLF